MSRVFPYRTPGFYYKISRKTPEIYYKIYGKTPGVYYKISKSTGKLLDFTTKSTGKLLEFTTKSQNLRENSWNLGLKKQQQHCNIFCCFVLYQKGDRILVTKMREDGIWEGQLKNGKKGIFPFRYVKIVSSSQQDIDAWNNSQSTSCKRIPQQQSNKQTNMCFKDGGSLSCPCYSQHVTSCRCVLSITLVPT